MVARVHHQQAGGCSHPDVLEGQAAAERDTRGMGRQEPHGAEQKQAPSPEPGTD